MRRVACALFVASLVMGGLALPAEARGWHHRHHGHRDFHHVRHHGHGHGHFAAGFLAGAATFLVVDALYTPRVVQPVYYRAPVCRDLWVPGRWEVRTRGQNSFTSYYQVWVEGHWQQQCS